MAGEVLGPYAAGRYIYEVQRMMAGPSEEILVGAEFKHVVEIWYPDSTMSYSAEGDDGRTASTFRWERSGLHLMQVDSTHESCSYPGGVRTLPRVLSEAATWEGSGACGGKTMKITGRARWEGGVWVLIRHMSTEFSGPHTTRLDFDDLSKPPIRIIRGATEELPGTDVYRRQP